MGRLDSHSTSVVERTMVSARKLNQYKDLIIHKAIADFRRESERTYIGVVWWVLEPLLYMAIYYVVFSVFLRVKVEDFVPFLLIGLVTFRWFAVALSRASTAILSNAALVHQVQFSNIIFPIIAIVTCTLQFLFSLAVLLILLRLFGMEVGLYYLAFPIVLFVELLLILGCGLVLSAVVPFVPDVSMLVEHLIRVVFYMSAIMYPVSILPEKAQFYLRFNPMLQLVEAMRDPLMYARWPSWDSLIILAFFSICAIGIGCKLITHFDTIYAKRIMR